MIKVGQTIKIENVVEEKKRIEKWKVIKIYPHMVLCCNAIGIRRCFTIGDLVTMGLMKQSDEIEALRKERESGIRDAQFTYQIAKVRNY